MELKLARILKGLTQQGFAKKLKVTQATVSHWETGLNGINKKRHKRIEKILGFPVDFETKSITHLQRTKGGKK